MLHLITAIIYAIYFATNVVAQSTCITAGGLTCEQGSIFDCTIVGGSLEDECEQNGGSCISQNNICICNNPIATRACSCSGPINEDVHCVDNKCGPADETGWECVPNDAKQCRCIKHCDDWKPCTANNCDQDQCTPCEVFQRGTAARIEVGHCKRTNNCMYDGKLCVEPPCKAPKGWKFCPRDQCDDCRPCWDHHDKQKKKCDDDCLYNGFPCIFEECCPPLGYEYCKEGDCSGCESCEKDINGKLVGKPCENPTTCSGDGGRCIRSTGEKCTSVQGLKGSAHGDKLWKYVINDYLDENRQKKVNVANKVTKRKGIKTENYGDYYENVLCKDNNPISNTQRKTIVDKCDKPGLTEEEKLKCVYNEIEILIGDKPDCVCRHHACAIWFVLKKFKDFDANDVNIIGSALKGRRIGHMLVCARYDETYTDKAGNEKTRKKTLYLDSHNEIILKCCPSDPTPSPTTDPTKSPTTDPTKAPTTDPTKTPTTDPTTVPVTVQRTKDPTTDPTKAPTTDPTKSPTTDPTNAPTTDPITNPSITDPSTTNPPINDFELKENDPDDTNCTYIFVDIPKSMEDAQKYCQDTYGTDLATINSEMDMLNGLFEMEGHSAWIGLKNTHKSGWFVHIDGTECENEYGSCVDEFLWKDGHPQKTCEKHAGSWSVALHDDGYIDNAVLEHVKIPFLCNCE